jgi:hypothetical protein
MAATQLTSGSTFDVWYASDPTDAQGWTHTVVDVGAIGSVAYTWAPEWFLDPSAGAGYQQVHILFAATAAPTARSSTRSTSPTSRRWVERQSR